jgi:RNA-binding protein Musashi
MSELFDSRPRAESGDVACRKIFIGGLSYSTDEEKLKRYFRDYGIVQDAVVMKDPVTKRSRGFGFITFFDPLSVDSVLAAEPHIVDGRKVEAKRAVPRSEMSNAGSGVISTSSLLIGKLGTPISSPLTEQHKSPPGGPAQNVFDESAYNKIFVGGLHYDTRDHEFREYFSRFGKVVHGEVMFNRETHKSRGFGFVVFESADSALRACDVREHIIDSKVVEVKLAIPRSKIGSSTPGTPSTGGAIPLMSLLSPPATTGVRGRTVSMGSGLSPSMPLSGNSSTLAAAQGAHKVGPGILSGNSGSLSLRKPASTNVVPLTVGGKPVNPSYSGSLRVNNNEIAGSSNEMDEFMGEDPLAGAYVEDFIFEQARPSRALSEPIVRYEFTPGNSSSVNSLFNNDMLSMNSFLQSSSGNSPPFSSAQKVSRGSGIHGQQHPRRSFALASSISPEPINLTDNLFSGGTEGSANTNLTSLLFLANELADSNINPGSADQNSSGGCIKSPPQQHSLFGSSGSDMLFSSPSRETFGEAQVSSSRRTSFTGVGSSSDIWANSGLSNQAASESMWANSSSGVFLDNNTNSSSSGLLGAIAAQANYSSRSVSKDEGSGGVNSLSSLLQHSSISTWTSGETSEVSGLATAQRRYSHSTVQNDGIVASISLNLGPGSSNVLSELRMNSHEYDIGGQGSSGLAHSNLGNLGNSWGNNGRGF